MQEERSARSSSSMSHHAGASRPRDGLTGAPPNRYTVRGRQASRPAHVRARRSWTDLPVPHDHSSDLRPLVAWPGLLFALNANRGYGNFGSPTTRAHTATRVPAGGAALEMPRQRRETVDLVDTTPAPCSTVLQSRFQTFRQRAQGIAVGMARQSTTTRRGHRLRSPVLDLPRRPDTS